MLFPKVNENIDMMMNQPTARVTGKQSFVAKTHTPPKHIPGPGTENFVLALP